jgi:hypothetical protein
MNSTSQIKKNKEIHDDDLLAQLEVLKNVKTFLTDQLQTTSEKCFTLENDIKTLK